MKLLKTVTAGLAWACIGVFLFLVLYSNYDAYLSPEALLAKKNAINIRKVRVGMDTVRVAGIMGRAADESSIQQEHIYYYTHQPGSSDSYQIKFNAAYKVIEIIILD
jgi:hypothetical protein